MKQKHYAFLLVSALLLITAGSLQAQDRDYAKTVIAKLASPEFKGRGYVGEGNQLAAMYIKREFEQIGLKPFRKSYLQPFTVPVNTFPKAMLLKLDGIPLLPGVDYIVDPASPSIQGTFQTIFLKKDDLADEAKIAATLKDAGGKILILDERGSLLTGPEQKKTISARRDYVLNSTQVPTAGTIIISTDKLTWSVSKSQSAKATITVNSSALEADQVREVTLDIDAEHIKKFPTQNVIGYIKGSQKPDSFLVFSAHYDHLGKMGEQAYFPGANDNASGIAMLLNLAKYYAAHPPKYSIAFIAFSSEELGLLGSRYYVDHPSFPLSKIKLLHNFDIAGTGDEGITVVNGTVYTREFDQLKRINEEQKLLSSVQVRGEACNSDHCIFYMKNVPSIYTYTRGGIQAYHDIYDKAETLPLTAFSNYFKLITLFYDQYH